jgi:uncharacterized protein
MPASFSTPNHDHQVVKRLFAEKPLAEHSVPLYQAYGFTLSVVSAPDIIQPSEYLPLLFKSEALPEFDSPQETQRIISGLLSIWTYWADQLRGKRHFKLPPECALLNAQGMPEPAFIDFCTGYLLGCDWLQESWDASLAKYDEESLESGLIATAMLLCLTICRPEVLKEQPEVANGLGEPLTPELALKMLPGALMDVAQLGLRFHREALQDAPPQKEDVTPGRNAPCPCGSGKKYKKCCQK